LRGEGKSVWVAAGWERNARLECAHRSELRNTEPTLASRQGGNAADVLQL